MSEKFDPYHKWLGIPASQQPPDKYRLLGVPLFEENATVIEHASDQRMAYLRTFQTGKHAAESQRLLNELAAARVCLLNANKKIAYDQLLRQRLAPSSEPAAAALDPRPAAGFETRLANNSAIGLKRPQYKSQSKARSMAIIAVAGLAVLAVSLALWVIFGHDNSSSNGQIAMAATPANSADPATDPSPKSSQAATKETSTPATAGAPTAMRPKETANGGEPKTAPVSKPPEPEVVRPAPRHEAPTEAKPASQGSLTEKPKPSEPEVPPKKLPPPPVEDQKRLMGEIDELYKPSEAKDQAAKADLAHKLLELGRNNDANRAEQFVLFRRAGEIARDAGDAELMLEAVDAIVAAGFDIRPYHVKARFLKQLLEQSPSGGDAQLSTHSACSVKFAEEAAANDAIDEAIDVLDAAKMSFARFAARLQAGLRAAKAAIARIRPPADKAASEKKVADLEAELDAVKSAQSAVADCAKAVQQARRDRDAILSAQERLSTNPDDADDCLAVGRWYCFNKGDWDVGLKLLAKGSDQALKSLAGEELTSKPATVGGQVARGDAWWELAVTAAGKAKFAMQQHAAVWYREAMPNLAPGLDKLKVEKRLAQVEEEPASETGEGSGPRPPLAIAPFDEKTAKLHQARWAKFLRLPVVLTNSIGMKLALIPAGEFQMGSSKEVIEEELQQHPDNGVEQERIPGEAPRHRVRITKPYWLGVTDLTQGEYERVMGVNSSRFQGDPNRPVDQVSWDGALEFCQRLSELPEEKAAKRRYGLPTEAQWEYACRAGSTSRFYFSDDESLMPEYGWFWQISNVQSHPVAQKLANAWGLYDMHGNVRQWCRDCYDKDYYGKSPLDDPRGPPSGLERVVRGGSWADKAECCRSAFRLQSKPAYPEPYLGLRVELLSAGEPDVKPAEVAAKYVYKTAANAEGSFLLYAREGKPEWIESKADGSAEYLFAETGRDQDWIYLLDAGRNLRLRLPVGGGGTCSWSRDGTTWNGMYHVEKAK